MIWIFRYFSRHCLLELFHYLTNFVVTRVLCLLLIVFLFKVFNIKITQYLPNKLPIQVTNIEILWLITEFHQRVDYNTKFTQYFIILFLFENTTFLFDFVVKCDFHVGLEGHLFLQYYFFEVCCLPLRIPSR